MSFDRLFFEEIDGARRKIVLSGTTAPMGGTRHEAAFVDGGDLRHTRRYEAGQRAPVVHVTGTQEHEWEIKGHHRDSLLGTRGAARELIDRIEAIRESGRPLRIVWGDQLRRGLLSKAKYPVEAEGEFRYELTFSIFDKGDPPARAERRRLIDIGPSVLEPLEALDSVRASLRVPGLGLDVQGTLDELFGAVLSPLADLIALAEAIEDEAVTLADALTSFASRCQIVFGRLLNLFAFVEAFRPDDERDARAAAAWRRAQAEALARLDRAAQRAFEVGVDAELKAQGEWSGAIVVAAEGDTLEEIARRLGCARARLVRLNPGVMGRLTRGQKLRAP